MIKETYKTISKLKYIKWVILPFNDDLEMSWCHVFTIFNLEIFKCTRRFGWPTATLLLAPAESWKGPSGPAGNFWPHLIYSSLERFRKFLEKN